MKQSSRDDKTNNEANHSSTKQKLLAQAGGVGVLARHQLERLGAVIDKINNKRSNTNQYQAANLSDDKVPQNVFS